MTLCFQQILWKNFPAFKRDCRCTQVGKKNLTTDDTDNTDLHGSEGAEKILARMSADQGKLYVRHVFGSGFRAFVRRAFVIG